MLFGGLHSFIATLVERRSRYVMLVKVNGKDSESVVSALTRHVQQLPKGLMRTLTWDRGSEMAQHRKFSIATDVQVYFCDPASPWQRGSNENTNGLLRQYFPKGMDLTDVSQAHLNAVAKQLNGRPRMTLGYATPAEGTIANRCIDGLRPPEAAGPGLKPAAHGLPAQAGTG